METTELMVSLVVSLLTTIFIYLIVPTIIILCGKKYTKKTLKTIAIVNGVVGFIIFNIIRGFLGEEISSNVFPAFLWSSVAYWLLRKGCLKESIEQEDTRVSEKEMSEEECVEDEKETELMQDVWEADFSVSREQYIQEENRKRVMSKKEKRLRYCSRCGSVIDNETKKCTGCGKQYFKGIRFSKSLVVIIALLVVVIGLTVLNINQYDDCQFYKDNCKMKDEQIENWRNRVATLDAQISEYKSKVEFMDEYVVCVEDDGTNLYHRYECERFVGNSFWVFNVDTAEVRGYRACPDCH